jgi:hypothetical protein
VFESRKRHQKINNLAVFHFRFVDARNQIAITFDKPDPLHHFISLRQQKPSTLLGVILTTYSIHI